MESLPFTTKFASIDNYLRECISVANPNLSLSQTYRTQKSYNNSNYWLIINNNNHEATYTELPVAPAGSIILYYAKDKTIFLVICWFILFNVYDI